MSPEDSTRAGSEADLQTLQQELQRLRSVRRELKHSLDELREIQTLARTIRSTNQPEAILEALEDLLGRILPAPELGLFLFQQEEVVPVGDPILGIREAFHSLTEEGITDWLLEEGRPISVPDLSGRKSPEHSDLLVPLKMMNAGIGVLFIRSGLLEQDLTAQQLDLVSFAAGQAAMALENARLLEQLSTSQRHLQEMIDHATDLILVLDEDARIRYANERAEQLGFDARRIVGRSLLDFLDEADERAELLEFLRSGDRGLRELNLQVGEGPDGRRIVQLALSPLPPGHPLRGSALAVLRDLTEQRRLEHKAREMERLEAVMLAAVTVNHEINNPLTTIVGNLFLIRRELGEDISDSLRQRLDHVESNCKKIEKVARHLEQIEEIKLVKYLGDTEMLDIDLDDSEEN